MEETIGECQKKQRDCGKKDCWTGDGKFHGGGKLT
jgi:hypothetical protein